NQLGEILELLGRGKRINRVSPHHGGLLHVVDVHHRGRAGYRDRLTELSERHLDAHIRREVARELDVFSLYRGKTGQRERHGVDAGDEFQDLVLATGIGDDTAYFFN